VRLPFQRIERRVPDYHIDVDEPSTWYHKPNAPLAPANASTTPHSSPQGYPSEVRLTVYGHAKPSVRITGKSKWSKSARSYLDWQALVADYCKTVKGRPVPWKAIRLDMTFYFANRRHGDITNILKSTEDGCQYGNLIENDRFVRETRGRIFYCPTLAGERVEITVSEFTDKE
jgi:crossover junction endodeoxyribonuclease RusA